MSIKRIDKQIVVNPYNEKLLSNTKEQTIDTCNYMSETKYQTVKKSAKGMLLYELKF